MPENEETDPKVPSKASPDSESEAWFKDELMANYDAFVTEHAKLSQADKERV